VISFDHLTYRYPAATEQQHPQPVLQDLSLTIGRGAFVLVIGPSGSGKSTLLRCINGLVPHFYGGTLSGHIRVAGHDPVTLEPRHMSPIVGFVFQDPEAQAVVDMVEDELVFAMENHGLSPDTMRQRVEEVLDQLSIAHLRRRQLSTLSGGERQRVAIAAVLVLHPQVVVLDEPTSQLDPQSAEEVLDALVKLNHELGLTILLSEHRLERVIAHVNHVLYLPGAGQPPLFGDPAQVLAQAPLVPPLVELGKRLGWSPLPLTVQDARRFAWALPMYPSTQSTALAPANPGSELHPEHAPVHDLDQTMLTTPSQHPPSDTVLEIHNLSFSYKTGPLQKAKLALRDIDLVIRRGETVAIMGRNGAGKSTLLKHCVGLLKPDRGQVRVMGMDTRSTPIDRLAQHIGYVPQNPNALLFADTVADELAFTRRAKGISPSDDTPLLQTLGLSEMRQDYPRDLSVGERQRVALAAVLVGDPELILLDEPTRGLDYVQKAALTAFLRTQKEQQKAIIVITHDVELVAQCADRAVVLGDGEIVVDDQVRKVMSAWPLFASQISRLFSSPQFLTVEDVIAALDRVETIP